jgi:hypothetical protein
VRDWIAVLDLLRQNSDLTLPALLQGQPFTARLTDMPPGSIPSGPNKNGGSGGKTGSDLPEFIL